MAPLISVIVPARDEEAALPKLLESLDRQTMTGGDFEVIVADNGSRDGTAEAARGFGARVVAEPRPGRAGARNRAAATSTADLFAFTDADCVVDPGWLDALTGCLRRTPLAGGPVEIVTGERPQPLERLESLWRFRGLEASSKNEGWTVTANLGITRAAFDAVGGFDPSFRHIGEDVDLCLRAARAGRRLGWCPQAVVLHPAERRLWPALRRAAAQAHSEHQIRSAHGRPGGSQWRHPGPLVRGDWALRRFGVDPDAMDPAERRRLLRLARLEYAGRMAGAMWARLSLGPSPGP